MLLNESSRSHRVVEEQKVGLIQMMSNFVKQEAIIAKQHRQSATLTASVQKVSEELGIEQICAASGSNRPETLPDRIAHQQRTVNLVRSNIGTNLPQVQRRDCALKTANWENAL